MKMDMSKSRGFLNISIIFFFELLHNSRWLPSTLQEFSYTLKYAGSEKYLETVTVFF